MAGYQASASRLVLEQICEQCTSYRGPVARVDPSSSRPLVPSPLSSHGHTSPHHIMHTLTVSVYILLMSSLLVVMSASCMARHFYSRESLVPSRVTDHTENNGHVSGTYHDGRRRRIRGFHFNSFFRAL